jgi:hypothetical protein
MPASLRHRGLLGLRHRLRHSPALHVYNHITSPAARPPRSCVVAAVFLCHRVVLAGNAAAEWGCGGALRDAQQASRSFLTREVTLLQVREPVGWLTVVEGG